MQAVWLGDDLIKDVSGTMHRLSTHPEAFGTPKPCQEVISCDGTVDNDAKREKSTYAEACVELEDYW